MDWNYMETRVGMERVSRPDWKMPENPIHWRGELESDHKAASGPIENVTTDVPGSSSSVALYFVVGVLVAMFVRGC